MKEVLSKTRYYNKKMQLRSIAPKRVILFFYKKMCEKTNNTLIRTDVLSPMSPLFNLTFYINIFLQTINMYYLFTVIIVCNIYIFNKFFYIFNNKKMVTMVTNSILPCKYKGFGCHQFFLILVTMVTPPKLEL